MPSSKLPALESIPSLTAFRAPRLMGVVNVSPDSFYPGSRSASMEEAVERGLRLAAEGADFLDVGGQSTRPGSEPAALEIELKRVIPAVRALARQCRIPISVDTDKAAVAAEALAAGARFVNDVTALRGDPGMAAVAAQAEGVVLMHMRGKPRDMQDAPRYNDVVREVIEFLRGRLAAFAAAGGDPSRVWVDPGIGFGKTLEHNLALMRGAKELSALAPVLLGVSRKSLFSKITPDAGPEERLPDSLALSVWAGLSGVSVLRVHDVAPTRRALRAFAAVAEPRS